MCATPQGPNDHPIRTAIAALMRGPAPRGAMPSMAASGIAPRAPTTASRLYQQRRQAAAPGNA